MLINELNPCGFAWFNKLKVNFFLITSSGHREQIFKINDSHIILCLADWVECALEDMYLNKSCSSIFICFVHLFEQAYHQKDFS